MVNSKCPNCLKIIKNEQCEFCDCINYNVEPGRSIPEEIKKKVIENTFKKPIREELDENKLELLLKDSLKMCKYKSDYNFIKPNKKVVKFPVKHTTPKKTKKVVRKATPKRPVNKRKPVSTKPVSSMQGSGICFIKLVIISRG